MSDLPSGAWNAHWISLSADPREDLGVFGFRRLLSVDSVSQELKVRVSADQRYKLYVNGQFVGFGPQRGDEKHWFYETYDLAPFLKQGENWVAALVWNFGRWAPMAQHSARTGFVLESLGRQHSTLDTSENWEVARLSNWSFDMMHSEDMHFYIDIGPGEIMDFRGAPWGWRTGEDAKGLADWRKANIVCRAEDRGTMGGMTPWSLIPRSIPSMLYEERAKAPKLRRGFLGDSNRSDVSDQSDPSDEFQLELGRKYLFDYEELLCAYPRVTVSGPAGTVLVLTYAEGMWEEKGGKGNRNEVKGKRMSGYQDKIILDGEKRTIEPLWWRTYRYLQIEAFGPKVGEGVRAKGEEMEISSPLTLRSSPILHHLSSFETGYPLKEESSFTADDPWVKPIWDVSLRTARRCAGETYFDCPYYEQLQYVGDTRIQALIGYYLGWDRALQRNAVETLGWSLMENGLTQSRYPSRQAQIIPPFSLWWVMMLWDAMLYDHRNTDESGNQYAWWTEESDRYRRIKGVTNTFSALGWRGRKDKRTFWNFGDWVPNWKWGVPPNGALSTMHELTYALASRIVLHSSSTPQETWKPEQLQYMVDLALRNFEFENGLIHHKEDSAGGYSEHAEALYRLNIELMGQPMPPWPTEALAKANAAKCTYYFSYYKHLAMFGRPDVDLTQVPEIQNPKSKIQNRFDYMTELDPWKEQIENGLTTFAENPEPTRSDCHAWSAHPILGFFQIVAGVTSIAPGWKKARIDPRPGSLKRFDAKIAHPDGLLQVKLESGKLEIDSPIPFELRWKGKKDELNAGRHQVG